MAETVLHGLASSSEMLVEAEVIQLGNKAIRDCIQCGYCFDHKSCVFKDDDVNSFVEKAKEAGIPYPKIEQVASTNFINRQANSI